MTDEELDIAARTVYGEARGEPFAGKLAVAWVIRNRVNRKRFGSGVIGVCLKKYQFSCWLPDDPNSKILKSKTPKGAAWGDCKTAVVQAFSDTVEDPTHGATHYCVLSMTPKWAIGKTPSATIGGHKFFANIA